MTGGEADRAISLLPKDWWRAPLVWRKQRPHAFWIFVTVNFAFGTLGIWLPLINALLGGHSSFWDEWRKLLVGGGFYMYAVPFLAATVGVVFTSLMQETAEHARGTKILFSFASIIIFVVCVVLLQIQVLGPERSMENINFGLQLLVSLATVLVALYVHAIIQNEIGGSPQDDMEQNASTLTKRAQKAAVNPGDFQ